MIILSIDTSTSRLSLAVSDGARVLRYRNLLTPGTLSSKLIPAVDGLLKRAQLTITDVDGLAVGLGPGSFTGLRVGLSAVKGLAFSIGKPVVGVSSLDLLARAVKDQAGENICVVTDARRGLVFCAVYRVKGDQWERRSDYLLIRPEEVGEYCNGPTLLTGDGLALVRDRITKTDRLEPSFAPPLLWQPQARFLPALTVERFEQGKTDDTDRLTPLYLYPQDCQVRKGR